MHLSEFALVEFLMRESRERGEGEFSSSAQLLDVNNHDSIQCITHEHTKILRRMYVRPNVILKCWSDKIEFEDLHIIYQGG